MILKIEGTKTEQLVRAVHDPFLVFFLLLPRKGIENSQVVLTWVLSSLLPHKEGEATACGRVGS